MKKKSSSKRKKVSKIHHKVRHHRKHEDDGVTYVGINNPTEFRKSILSSAIETSYGLRNYHRFMQVRDQKMKKMHLIRNIFNKIDKEMRSLRRHLPKEKELEGFDIPVKKEVEEIKKVEVKQNNKKLTDEDRLEKEIMDMKMKLSGLGGY